MAPSLTLHRYENRELLGQGGNGVVHAVWDHLRGEAVARKRVRSLSAASGADLRAEFRQLAEVCHPGLVQLHELGHDEEGWWYTMDLVPGRTFLHHVFGHPAGLGESQAPTWHDSGPVSDIPAPPRASLTEEVVVRLRASLAGLAEALLALHDLGWLHRDIKPGNVLVRPDGRVVLVDFGLVVPRGTDAHDTMSGTIAYLAPELLDLVAPGPESDWYAVGVILFEALTGRPPFVGPAARVLFDKRLMDAPPVLSLAPDAPDDLAALADRLLAREPAQRLGGQDVARALGLRLPRLTRRAPFLGRTRELAVLHHQLAQSDRGLRVVHLSAPSGFGKSAFLKEFVRTLSGEAYSGRCYEGDRVPFNALDAVVEHLMTREVQAGPAPTEVGALLNLFPALPSWRHLPRVPPLPRRADELRRAVALLADLLRRRAEKRPVALLLDDLQWADADSIELLSQFLAHEPPILLVLGWRQGQAPPRLASARAPDAEVFLGGLPAEEARQLLQHLVPTDPTQAPPAWFEPVLAQSEGSPFFLEQIAQLVIDRPLPDQTDLVREALRARTEQLEPPARALLSAIALAGRPLPLEVALQAARLAGATAGQREVGQLAHSRLILVNRHQSVECAHDRIRETTCEDFGEAERRSLHHALGQALTERSDHASAAHHWEHAGALDLARQSALKAAYAADKEQAPLRAVEAWRRCERLAAPADQRHPELLAGLGRALARAGQAQAADYLLGAAEGAPPEEALVLRLEAAQQLLRSGRSAEALPQLPGLLRQVGLPWPRHRALALASLAARSLWLSLPLPWRAGRARPSDGLRLAVAQELSLSLSYVDMVRAGLFTTHAIALAERTGDPAKLALAAAMRCSNSSLTGTDTQADHWWRRAEALLQPELPDPDRAAIEVHRVVADSAGGRWEEARRRGADVDRRLEGQGRPFEQNMVRAFLANALLQAGEVGAFEDLRRAQIERSSRAGDSTTEAIFRAAYGLPVGLAHGDLDLAEANLAQVRALAWPEGSSLWLLTECTDTHLAAYHNQAGQRLEAQRRVVTAARRSGILQVKMIHTACFHALALAAWQAGAAGKSDLTQAARALSRSAEPQARTCARWWSLVLDDPPAAVLADRLSAILAHLPPWLAELQRANIAAWRGAPEAPGGTLLAPSADRRSLGRMVGPAPRSG